MRKFVINKNLFITVAAFLVGALFLFIGQHFNSQKNIYSNVEESKIPVNISDSGDKLEVSSSIEPGADAAAQSGEISVNPSPNILKLSDIERKKLSILQEILLSKNDNDPRLDKELTELSPLMHQVLKEKYLELPRESRNERGLITYILARDLRTIEDLEFLKSVYEETPCLSLENCSVRSNTGSHLSGADQISMNYPQIALLYQLEKQMERNPQKFTGSAMRDRLLALLALAKKFEVPAVRNKAEQISNNIGF